MKKTKFNKGDKVWYIKGWKEDTFEIQLRGILTITYCGRLPGEPSFSMCSSPRSGGSSGAGAPALGSGKEPTPLRAPCASMRRCRPSWSASRRSSNIGAGQLRSAAPQAASQALPATRLPAVSLRGRLPDHRSCTAAPAGTRDFW